MILGKLRNDPKEWLKDVFPIARWLPKYKLQNIPFDFIAGLTVALTLLPISLAYAQMASLKTQYGLYSSFLAQFIYIFMGTSKDAIIGPSAINSMLVGQFNAMNPLVSEGDNTYSVILSFTSGIILFFVGVLKLGFIVNLFSIPVVSGFTTAASLTIMASQLKSFFGLKSAPNDAPAMFVRQVKNVYDHWDKIHHLDMYFGLGSLGFLLITEYSQKIVMICVEKYGEPKTPMGKKILRIFLQVYRIVISSRNIMVFIPATGIAYYLISSDPEYKNKLTIVGDIKRGFPTPSFPAFAIYNSTTGETIETASEIFTKLSVGFIIIPLMLMMELFAILKALARKNGYRLDATNELVAIGLGNFLQSFIQAYPVTAATAKSALNDQCRVKSLLSTIVSIVLIVVAIEAMTDIFCYVPKAVLAAILIASAHHLFDYETVIHLYREYKPDLFMFVVTFLLCLFYDLAYGILIAILLNMITFLRPVVRMDICVTKEPLIFEGQLEYVTVIQLSHGMKYPSVDKFIDRMARLLSTSDHHFVIDCRFVTGIDFSGLQAWRLFLRMVYQKKKHVIFANLLDSVRHQLEVVGLEHFRYMEDIENAVKEHHIIKTNMSQDAKVANNNEKASNPRLHHMISIISTSDINSMAAGRRQSRLHSQSADSNVLKAVGSITDQMPAHQQETHLDENADRKEQEARLMKVLSFQPHYFHDIPLPNTNESPDDFDENESKGKKTDLPDYDGGFVQPVRPRGYSLFPMVSDSLMNGSGRMPFEVGSIGSHSNLEKLTEGVPVPPSFWTSRQPDVNKISWRTGGARRRKTVHAPNASGPHQFNRSFSHDFSGEPDDKINDSQLVNTATQTAVEEEKQKTVNNNENNE